MKRIVLSLAAALVTGAAPLRAQELRLELPDRAPAGVMSYRGADWLERPERVAEEMPEQVLAVMRLQDGEVVADLGAGSGYYTRRMARRVAPSGRVYAVDIQPEMLRILEQNMEQEGITNVESVRGAVDDPRLPAGEMDWIFLADVYHEFSEPEPMLEGMFEALAADGRIALLEYRVEDGTGDHILAAHRMSVRQVITEWEPAGFQLVELHEFLPAQHLFIFQKEGGALPSIPHHDLFDAVAAGLVDVEVQGEGPLSVRVSVERLTPQPLVITFPVGTYFAAGEGFSDMVALRDGVALLADEGTVDWSVSARRAHPTDVVPGVRDVLTPQPADDHRRERNVMWVYQGLDFPPQIAPVLEQATLWIASVDAGYDDLAAYLRDAPLPAPNAIALALAYLESAGMAVNSTRVWRERDRYLPSISDPSLRALFDGWGPA
jgi:FkbM family methyltransferase